MAEDTDLREPCCHDFRTYWYTAYQLNCRATAVAAANMRAARSRQKQFRLSSPLKAESGDPVVQYMPAIEVTAGDKGKTPIFVCAVDPRGFGDDATIRVFSSGRRTYRRNTPYRPTISSSSSLCTTR
jgi:hypothetical protein